MIALLSDTRPLLSPYGRDDESGDKSDDEESADGPESFPQRSMFTRPSHGAAVLLAAFMVTQTACLICGLRWI
jgi:hypothetical protein